MKRGSVRWIAAVAVVLVNLSVVAAQPRSARDAASDQMLDEGFKLAQRGDHQGAIEKYQLGLSITPSNGLGHYYLAESLKALGRTGDATNHYAEAGRLLPETKEGVLARAIVLQHQQRVGELAQRLVGQWCHDWWSPGSYSDRTTLSLVLTFSKDGTWTHVYERMERSKNFGFTSTDRERSVFSGTWRAVGLRDGRLSVARTQLEYRNKRNKDPEEVKQTAIDSTHPFNVAARELKWFDDAADRTKSTEYRRCD